MTTHHPSLPSGSSGTADGGRVHHAHRRPAPAGLAAALLVTVAVLAGACSSSGTSASSTSAATGPNASKPAATLTIVNFSFVPHSLTVTPGQKIKVTNQDAVAHTVTADNHQFDTGSIAPGSSVTFTAPTALGSYAYKCTVHPYMTGTIVVS